MTPQENKDARNEINPSLRELKARGVIDYCIYVSEQPEDTLHFWEGPNWSRREEVMADMPEDLWFDALTALIVVSQYLQPAPKPYVH